MRRFARRTALLALPFLLGFFLFYVLPFGRVVYYAVTKSAMDHRFVGLANFAETMRNPYFQLAARNTIFFLLGGIPLVIVASFLLSLPLYHVVKNQSSFLHSAFILPMLLPSAAIVVIIRLYFTSKVSPVADFLQRIGLDRGALALLSVYFIFLWKNAGFQIILDLAALRSVPKDIQEAAALDGANAVQRFEYIVFPWLRPTLLFGVILAGAQGLRIYRETYLLYGEYPQDSVYFLQHYMNNHFYKLNYQRIASAALLLMAPLMLAAILVGICTRRGQKNVA